MKKTFIIMFAILTVICACTKTDSWNENSKPNIASNDMTLEAVKKSALGFINDIKPVTRGKNFEIGSVYAWRSDELSGKNRSDETNGENPDTTLYIVNFTDNNGYLLLSAKDPKHEVVAYIEEGNLTPTTRIDNPGMQLFLGRVGEYIDRSLIKPDPIMPVDTLPFWNGGIRVLNPLMKTTWHQFSPFNDQCPIVNGSHVPAGCGPLATAQIIAYHKSPASYNGYIFAWDSISVRFTPSTEIGRTGAAYLVNQIGILEYANYSPEGTGTRYEDIAFAFNALGYSYSYGDYSYNKCKQSISANRPVFISGHDNIAHSGHAWVIDDYYDRIELVEDHLANGVILYRYVVTGNFVHCNWGWTDNSNGYFLSGVFDTQQKVYEEDSYVGELEQGNHYFNYTSELQIYYNIHPNN